MSSLFSQRFPVLAVNFDASDSYRFQYLFYDSVSFFKGLLLGKEVAIDDVSKMINLSFTSPLFLLTFLINLIQCQQLFEEDYRHNHHRSFLNIHRHHNHHNSLHDPSFIYLFPSTQLPFASIPSEKETLSRRQGEGREFSQTASYGFNGYQVEDRVGNSNLAELRVKQSGNGLGDTSLSRTQHKDKVVMAAVPNLSSATNKEEGEEEGKFYSQLHLLLST